MSSIERKINLYKLYNCKNCLNPKALFDFDTKPKLKSEKELKHDKDSEFENKIKKIFQQNKFCINNEYDHNGAEKFLKEKDECLKKIEFDDSNSILYENLNMNKRSKKEKNKYKSHQNLGSVDIKRQTQIKNNNQRVIDSFLSNESGKSGDSIEEILELLK